MAFIIILMQDKEIRAKIQELSLGVLNTLIDSSLFLFAFWAQSSAVGSGRKDTFSAFEDSVEFIRQIRKKTLRRGTYYAANKGYLAKKNNEWQITELGRKRLEEFLPNYRAERPWDGKIYLVTYDIPEKRRKDRNLLRDYLKRVGCGMLQASVWITPYNPKKIIADFVAENKLAGLVIVSDVGRDGNVGQMPLRGLVEKVYRLGELNDRYREFLEKAEESKFASWEMTLAFFSILKDDPQLPFSLLPKDWLGDTAYRVYQKIRSQFPVNYDNFNAAARKKS
ncbi:CRISPR-associated endonuclease Cas2 [Candidatus Shapirobacteria bacterium]|nr:CRISPR-associated endonuclease Cas2 [Candidatus Shapirobacteria bacterium]